MIQIQDKTIGLGHPTFIVAEIGINHNGDMNLAKDMILAAKKAGVDAVKFQNYYTEDFILDKELTYEYWSQGNQIVETQFEMFKRYELNPVQLAELKNYCDNLKLIFFSTPTSLRGIQDLKKINTPLIKNGSDFLVNLELISEMAKSQIPTVISTGMATLAEIDDAVRTFEQFGGKELIILHCISAYPTPATEVNLRKIPALIQAFDYPIGFSDHTEGIIASVGAVILGACFIEKHFTLDKLLEGPDHRFSSDFDEMKCLVDAIRIAESSLGSSKLIPTLKETHGRTNFRLSCVASRDLPKGHLIQREDIAFSRPAIGLPPKFLNFLIGKELQEDLKKNQYFSF